MGDTNIEGVVNELAYIRDKLHNGILGDRSTPALTEAIHLLNQFKWVKSVFCSKDSPNQMSIIDYLISMGGAE